MALQTTTTETNMIEQIIVDPPQGWRYGFPKLYNPLPGETFVDWMIREGYPSEEAQWASEHCRCWSA